MLHIARIVAPILAAVLILVPVATAWAETPAPAAAPSTTGQASETPAPANPGALDTEIYTRSLAALTMLFVMAVLLENAFSIIFNWRVFLTYFSLRGVKTIIMVAIAYLIVSLFHLDIVAALLSAYNAHTLQPKPVASGFLSKFITALILAGGSAGVYNIMYALGYRSDRRDEEVNPRPPPNKAWVAVRAKRDQAAGEIFVTVREIKSAADKSAAPIAGQIGVRRPSLWELLVRKRNRFPQNGGYTVTPNVVYEITVEAKNSNGEPLKRLGEQYVFAEGAIVDFDVTI
jgi:hypothetical protein